MIPRTVLWASSLISMFYEARILPREARFMFLEKVKSQKVERCSDHGGTKRLTLHSNVCHPPKKPSEKLHLQNAYNFIAAQHSLKDRPAANGTNQRLCVPVIKEHRILMKTPYVDQGYCIVEV
ncbi:hypothetical protein JTE90_015489 [Oedothorax gibbosus]|uniref:Secreted protein n=1 Tax=Oedothorax gibbosus TaxID=931172 RepID=A0AAV6VPC1_9ARAC|nr:hypothetical protein JTE90_015489 [Oedothorax gibbosus]